MAQEIYRDLGGVAGVESTIDATPQSTEHYVYADKIRFVDGVPRKIGGWQSILFDNNGAIDGCARTIFSYYYVGNTNYLIGTDLALYYLLGSRLSNITPLSTSTTGIPDSLDSYYGTLANNPITTVLDSNEITIADANTRVRAGDVITLSGASTTNGIPNTQINATHFVRTQSTNSYTVVVSSNATSSGTGGGASVVQATPIITVNVTGHGKADGERIGLTGAATFAGIPDTEINTEHVIRNVTTDTFDIVVSTNASSSVSAGGGAATEIQYQIARGQCDATDGFGYGLGEYGVGLYGVPKTSGDPLLPRIWSFDAYGTDVIMTPGGQTGVYIWDNDLDVGPVPLSNAPTATNYVFVSNNIVVTLGADNVGNRIKSSDNVDITVWTPAATNQAYLNDVSEAAFWVSAAPARGLYLLFTDSQVFTFRYINRPLIWEVKQLDNSSGIIAQNARVSHNGVVYWMGNSNFFMYRGGNVEVIPSNTSVQSTIYDYVFMDLNYAQKSKCFAWYNKDFNEVWFHYPSAASNEPNRIARINIIEFTHTMDTMDRTAAEYPATLNRYPYLIASDDTLYKHELGYDDDGAPLEFQLTTPYYGGESDKVNLKGFVPDSIQTGDIEVTVYTKDYPQASNIQTRGPYTISSSTNMISAENAGRYWQYNITGNDLSQNWIGGRWKEIVAKGSAS